MRAAFGAKRLEASSSLLVLGVAFTVLAATYLAIQYMLALKRTWFLIALGRGRRRRADPAAPGLQPTQASRRSCSRSRRWAHCSRSGWRCGASPRPATRAARPEPA